MSRFTATDRRLQQQPDISFLVGRPRSDNHRPRPQFNLKNGSLLLSKCGGRMQPAARRRSAPAKPTPRLSISSGGAITGVVSPRRRRPGVVSGPITATDGAYSASQTLTWNVAADPVGTWSGDNSPLDAAFGPAGPQGRHGFRTSGSGRRPKTIRPPRTDRRGRRPRLACFAAGTPLLTPNGAKPIGGNSSRAI